MMDNEPKNPIPIFYPEGSIFFAKLKDDGQYEAHASLKTPKVLKFEPSAGEDKVRVLDLTKGFALSGTTTGSLNTELWKVALLQPSLFRMIISKQKNLLGRWALQSPTHRPTSPRAIRVVGWTGDVEIRKA